MRKKSLFLVLFIVLAGLMISTSSSFAQNVDISNMDNAQLMVLLQAIMERIGDQDSPIQLSAGSGQQTEEIGNQDPDQLKIENGELKIEEAGVRIFSIYKNKKLILERLPDYLFYQPPTEVPDTEPNKEKKKDDEEIKIYTDPTPGKPCHVSYFNGVPSYAIWGYCCDTCPMTCGCG